MKSDAQDLGCESDARQLGEQGCSFFFCHIDHHSER
jgi:hypothetical protein